MKQDLLVALPVSLTPSNPPPIQAAIVIFLKGKSDLFAPHVSGAQWPKEEGTSSHPALHAAPFACTWPASALSTYSSTPRGDPCSSHINTSKLLTIPQPNKLSLAPRLLPLPEVLFTPLSTWQICTHYSIPSSKVPSLGKFLQLSQGTSNLSAVSIAHCKCFTHSPYLVF